MKLVYKKPRAVGMTLRAVKSIALTLSYTNRTALVFTRADPFQYLNMLKEYGVKATATPVRKNKKLVGYKFKAA